jgi:hypothetical protein
MTQYEKGFEDCKRQVKVAMVAAVENAILMEREACARLCENLQLTELVNRDWADGTYDCAKAIRARGEK